LLALLVGADPAGWGRRRVYLLLRRVRVHLQDSKKKVDDSGRRGEGRGARLCASFSNDAEGDGDADDTLVGFVAEVPKDALRFGAANARSSYLNGARSIPVNSAAATPPKAWPERSSLVAIHRAFEARRPGDRRRVLGQ